MAQNDIEKELF